MSALETIVKKEFAFLRREIADLRKIISSKQVPTKWVDQHTAMGMLNVKARQLLNLRVHKTKEGHFTGDIAWKKGRGRNVLYFLPDIEKYIGAVEMKRQ